MFGESMTTMPSIWASMYSWFTPTVLIVFLHLMIGTIVIASRKPNDQQQQQQNRQLGRSPSMLQRFKSINFHTYKSQEPISTFEKSPEINTFFSFQQNPEQQQPPYEQPYLSESPSMLNRLKSFNLYNYISQEPISPFTNTTDLNKSQVTETHYAPTHEPEHPQEPEPQVEGEEEELPEEEPMKSEEQTLDEIYSQLKESHVSRTKSDTKPASGEIPTKLFRKMKKSASTKSAFAHFEENDIVEARRPATVREWKGKLSEDDDDDEVDAKADDFINKFKQQLKLQRIDSIQRYKDIITRGSEK